MLGHEVGERLQRQPVDVGVGDLAADVGMDPSQPHPAAGFAHQADRLGGGFPFHPEVDLRSRGEELGMRTSADVDIEPQQHVDHDPGRAHQLGELGDLSRMVHHHPAHPRLHCLRQLLGGLVVAVEQQLVGGYAAA